MKRLTLILTVMAWMLGLVTGAAQTAPDPSLRASVISCSPGPEIYELAGHTALRIRGEGIDSVWNYGLFDFKQPNFVYRFVRGETDYMVGGYPFAWFLPEYVARGSRVVEQELNLTPGEVVRLRALLRTESLPQNCVYRYNYVRDNCATRIRDRIDDALGSPVVYTDSVTSRSWRDMMRRMHRDYPWYQFGIDMVLGSGLDAPVDSRAEMFAPVVFEQKLSTARRPDGEPLVRATRILTPGTDHATLPPTPWWRSPMALALLVLAVSAMVSAHDFRRRTLSRWWYTLWFTAVGLTGCLITFLVFFSSHEATSPNLLMLWANPVVLLIPICIWSRRLALITAGTALYECAASVVLLVYWGFQSQVTDPAILVMTGASAISAATYAIIAICKRCKQIIHQ